MNSKMFMLFSYLCCFLILYDGVYSLPHTLSNKTHNYNNGTVHIYNNGAVHEPKKIIITCVGDSLTFGHRGRGCNVSHSYPDILQAKLGTAKYKVYNFGRGIIS